MAKLLSTLRARELAFSSILKYFMFSGLPCSSDHLDVVGYLVNEAHCDPNVKSHKGETPLHRACRLIECITYCTCTRT